MPCSYGGHPPRISPHGHKRTKWSQITLYSPKDGTVAHKDLGGLIFQDAFAQPSDFCRFVRTLLRPLRDKIGTRAIIPPYLMTRGWPSAGRYLHYAFPRRELSKSSPLLHEAVIYTDASTSGRIIAPLVVAVAEFNDAQRFNELWAESAEPHCAVTFRHPYIFYGSGFSRY